MPRTFLNFVYQNRGEARKTLLHLHDGDLLPHGLLRFGIEEFLSIARPWTPDDFRSWIAKHDSAPVQSDNATAGNSDAAVEARSPRDLGPGIQPCVYRAYGYASFYSYVFHVSRWRLGARRNRVTVWCWNRRVFNGSAKQFLAYCREMKRR